MALEITKNFVVKAPPAAVWKFLVDVQRVARCMPGAAIGDKVDDKTYTGTMTVKVGPVTSSYKGKVVFEKLDAAAYSAEIVATGQDVKGKGGADMRLTSNLRQIAPGETEVTAISKVSITGILAQMGRGMINDVSDQLFKMFSERMRAELEAEAAAAITEPEAMAAETAASSGRFWPRAGSPLAARATERKWLRGMEIRTSAHRGRSGGMGVPPMRGEGVPPSRIAGVSPAFLVFSASRSSARTEITAPSIAGRAARTLRA